MMGVLSVRYKVWGINFGSIKCRARNCKGCKL